MKGSVFESHAHIAHMYQSLILIVTRKMRHSCHLESTLSFNNLSHLRVFFFSSLSSYALPSSSANNLVNSINISVLNWKMLHARVIIVHRSERNKLIFKNQSILNILLSSQIYSDFIILKFHHHILSKILHIINTLLPSHSSFIKKFESLIYELELFRYCFNNNAP